MVKSPVERLRAAAWSSARAFSSRLGDGLSLFDRLGEGAGGVRLQPHPPAAGLSLVHPYSGRGQEKPSAAVLRVSQNGNVSHLRQPRLSRPVVGERKKRGKVTGLSAGAAARCKRLLLSADQSRVETTWEGTLTVPLGEFTWEEFNHALKNWRDRFERKWPGVPVPWIKEMTEGWTPHLHFLVVWLRGQRVPSLKKFRKWNDGAWAKVVKSSHPSHEKTACRVMPVETWSRVVSYLSGYLTAVEGRRADAGRMWGCIGRKFFPASWVEVEVTKEEQKRLTRAIVRCRRSQRGVLMSAGSVRPDEKVDRWKRLSAAYCNVFSNGSPSEQFWMKMLKGAGFRLRVMRPRLYRRNGVKLWDMDAESRKVERRNVEQKKLYVRDHLTRKVLRDSSGEKQFEWVDEIESVAAAWHYLPSAEVLRLLAYVRRDRALGLTSCEKKWAGL